MSKTSTTFQAPRWRCRRRCGTRSAASTSATGPLISRIPTWRFTLRAKGLRTLYAPASPLIHHEGVSNGTDLAAGIKAHQIANQPKFIEKWQDVLATEHFPNGEEVFLARDRSRQKTHMLVIDHYVPQPDRDAGSRTLFSYMKMFVDAGLQVSFWPDNLYRDKDYLKALQDLGVEVLYGSQLVGRFPEWIVERAR